jgi:carboxylate-amine ligase
MDYAPAGQPGSLRRG